ncbi:MAG: hypothetical protein IPP77_00885 [Bacteroidetes bacterium]|nr:hypothetical protein [Bacteroidota bacterium]
MLSFKKIYSLLLPVFLFAGLVTFLPSCKKCKDCSLTTVLNCGKCAVNGFDISQGCEKDGKTAYNNMKSLCATATGTWTITSSDTTIVSEEVCANNKADVVDKSIDLRLQGYTCVDK